MPKVHFYIRKEDKKYRGNEQLDFYQAAIFYPNHARILIFLA